MCTIVKSQSHLLINSNDDDDNDKSNSTQCINLKQYKPQYIYSHTILHICMRYSIIRESR